MVEFSSSTYSATDASNTSASPNGAPEGMPPSGVNDTIRALIGANKRWWQRSQGAIASAGTSTAYTLDFTPDLAAYVTGERYSFRSHVANTTTTPTLSIDGLTATAIKKIGSSGKVDMGVGDIQIGQPVTVEYDGTHFVICTPIANLGTGTVTSVASGSGLTGGPVTTTGTLALDISGLTEDTAPATADFVPTYDTSGTANKKVAPRALVRAGRSFAIIADQKAQNTDGGTFTSGAWRTRDLQTEVSDVDAIVSISSNQFTLGAGTYHIRAVAPAYQVAEHQCRVYNITDAAVVGVGTVSRSAGTSQTVTTSSIEAIVTISGSKAFELQHQCASTGTTTGFGIKANFTTEQYATVCIERIA